MQSLCFHFFASCWDEPIPAWLVLSSSSFVLNKTCLPHAAALCYLQITATLPSSFFLDHSLSFFASLSSPLSQQMHFSPFPHTTLSSCSSSLSVSHCRFLRLFSFLHPSSICWCSFSQVIGTERSASLPLVQELWVVDCTEQAPKALQATTPHLFTLYSRGRGRSV